MLKKYKYLVAGIAIILFVMPLIVSSERLNDPRMNRDCYRGDLPFYVCVIQGTNIMEASFIAYQPMHDYYTPQLKEIPYTTGNMAISKRTTGSVRIGTYTVSNSAIEYSYVKGK